MALFYKLTLFICCVSFMQVSAQTEMNSLKENDFRIVDSGYVTDHPPFKSCHSVTIAEVGKDTLMYAWFGGDYEGAENVAIWGIYRYTRQKNQWSDPILLATGHDSLGNAKPCWNPVLYTTFDGVVFLDYKVGDNPREWWAERKVSYDHGKTWSESNRLPKPFLGPIKNKPLQLDQKTLLFPSSTESLDGTWQVHLELSDDSGQNWKYITLVSDSLGVIQPCLLRYGADTLQLLCRSRQNAIAEAWSFDRGISWTELMLTELPNPNSGIDVVTLSDGLQLLVYNPLLPGQHWWDGRSVLKVALSKNGEDWTETLVLEDHKKGEYSYPAIIQDSTGVVRIAYTDNRLNIKFVDLEKVD